MLLRIRYKTNYSNKFIQEEKGACRRSIPYLQDTAWTSKETCLAEGASFGNRRILSGHKNGHTLSPEQAEAKALLLVARTAKANNWSSVTFHSDA